MSFPWCGSRPHRRAAGWLVLVAATPVSAQSGSPTAPITLETVRVTGTHLRAPANASLSPLQAYDRAYIEATGALTLADFLRYLPQNYPGIGVGRGSAPDERNPAFGQATETSSPAFDLLRGAAAAPPGQTGLSGANLRGLGSGSTLVLVDGRRIARSGEGNRGTDSSQGFVNLNTVPLGAIERIETITDGASAIYGADAIGGVINIILRKNYTGTELTSTFRGTTSGGARERHVGLSTGFARGPWQGMLLLDYYDRADLRADQRGFSREQDHTTRLVGLAADGTPVFGRDLRLNWGYPAVVQAVTGNLNGISDATGNPTRVALAPAGTDGLALTPARFTAGVPARPGAAVIANGQRRGNTAEFIDLLPPSERRSVSGSFTRAFAGGVELYGRATVTDVRGLFSTQPPVSTAATSTGFGSFATIVPAAFNPFGQDIAVGWVHHEFGSVTQATRTLAHSATLGLRGSWGQTWRWDAGLTWSRDRLTRVTRDLNPAGVTAALRDPDPARRLNPFADVRTTGPRQVALYESLARYSRSYSRGEQAALDFTSDGELATLPSGPIGAAFGLELGADENENRQQLPDATDATGDRERRVAVFAETRVPLTRALQLLGALRHEARPRSGTSTHPKLGLAWKPHPAWLVRAGYSTGFRTPALTELQNVAQVGTGTSSIVDPRRGGEASDIPVVSGGHSQLTPERSTHRLAGLTWEAGFVPGLRLSFDYYDVEQRGALQYLATQDFVDFESAFAERIVRAPASAADAARGYAGRIQSVDITLMNFGVVRNRSADYRAEYRFVARNLGRFRLDATVSQNLHATFAGAPGRPPRDDLSDTSAAPKWKGLAALFWDRGNWNGAAFVSTLGGFDTNRTGNALASAEGYPTWTTLDLRASYRFARSGWRGRGQGLRLGVGVGNLLDRAPPFSDTVFGFNGALHSAAGRTYEFTAAVPF